MLFCAEELWDLFSRCGFDPVENGYVRRETVNHKEGRSAARVFVQGKYLKRGGNSPAPAGFDIAGESQVCGSVKIDPKGLASSSGESPKTE